jgi:hypothetical protein
VCRYKCVLDVRGVGIKYRLDRREKAPVWFCTVLKTEPLHCDHSAIRELHKQCSSDCDRCACSYKMYQTAPRAIQTAYIACSKDICYCTAVCIQKNRQFLHPSEHCNVKMLITAMFLFRNWKFGIRNGRNEKLILSM